ncbi:4059_t:CDS:2, partial [Cetraspora pellucida]
MNNCYNCNNNWNISTLDQGDQLIEIELKIVIIFAKSSHKVAIHASYVMHTEVHRSTGIAAMHICLASSKKIIIIDKVQNNSLALTDGRPASSVEYDLNTGSKRLLPLKTNTFCSAGSYLGDGTLLSTGGAENKKSYDEGFTSLRTITPCDDGSCQWKEDPKGMSTNRWYPTATSLSDGSVFILGGSNRSIAVNEATFNNPTYEFFPKPKKNPGPRHLQFLVDTLPFNLYPMVHLMPGPNGQTHLFIMANQDSIIFDWSTGNVVKKLPKIPGGPRNYPLTGTSVMLPLRPDNNYKPQVLVCGGNSKNDPKNEALNSCGRIDLSLDKPQWEMDNFGGFGRVMPDAVLLADGTVLFLNGASTGVAGYNKDDKHLKADNPVLTAVLYDDTKPVGKRFKTLDSSTIPRLYHSVALLLPTAKVFVTGSSPQDSILTKGVKFPTEFRVEEFSPPYLSSNQPRGNIISVANSTDINHKPTKVKYNSA